MNKSNVNESNVQVPLYNLKMMSDEEWNRLAYINWLIRNSSSEKNKKNSD